MGRIVIVAYRPKPGREKELEALVRAHVPVLRELDLATDRPVAAMRAKDGTVVEMFEWVEGGIDAAHSHPKVLEMWGKFAAVCDYVPLKALDEAAQMFAEFTPIELRLAM
ncbi:MAG TPA: hypothetical protein VHU23_02005 [Rhizomicrobium sp.]|jgi:hypothetical protein|nr:hypothetical protein [Rhizomicrobium sp.]